MQTSILPIQFGFRSPAHCSWIFLSDLSAHDPINFNGGGWSWLRGKLAAASDRGTSSFKIYQNWSILEWANCLWAELDCAIECRPMLHSTIQISYGEWISCTGVSDRAALLHIYYEVAMQQIGVRLEYQRAIRWKIL